MALQALNETLFEENVYDNGEKCLVVFTRKNCHVCIRLFPLLKNIADEFCGRFGCYSVDVEEEMDLYRRFPLQGVPSILFFAEGEYLGKLAGEMDKETITGKIATILALE